MPHSYLKVVGNLGYRCNNSSPRYSVRTTMPSLYPNLKISYVFKYKISITLLLFSYVLERVTPNQLQIYKKVVIISLVWANYYDLMSILEFQPSILSSACR